MKFKVMQAAHRIVKESFPWIGFDTISIYIQSKWKEIIGEKEVTENIVDDVALLFILRYRGN